MVTGRGSKPGTVTMGPATLLRGRGEVPWIWKGCDMNSPTQGMWECRHGADGRDYCDECHGHGYDAGPDPDADIVEDRWSRLLSLIAQYGGERFGAGWRAAITQPTVKIDSRSGLDDNEQLQAIVSELLALQRELGDD